MASFNFVVDTEPMAQEISGVSTRVNVVSGAVVAMQSAVIAAEQEGADQVCENVNKGFYSLMHSQISQKIAQLTSTVEAKLMELGQYAASLQVIQGRMENDYHMISGRYTKLFNTLNNNLKSRVAELDRPVFQLVDREMKRNNNRIALNSGQFTVNQLESVLGAQLISVSKVKSDAQKALQQITAFVAESDAAEKKQKDSMSSRRIDSMEEVFLPVSIVESTTNMGTPTVNFFVARSGNEIIDTEIDNSVKEQTYSAVVNGSWSEMDEDNLSRVRSEFATLLSSSDLDDRTKVTIGRLFNNMDKVEQLD